MRKILLSSLLLITLAGFKLSDNQGVYRWEYKLLIDTAGQRVFKMAAQSATINDLVTITRPQHEEMHNRRAEAEKRKVTVTAYAVEAGREDDGDYHLVLISLDGKDSLIAEIPDPLTPGLSDFPGLRNDFTTSRTFVEQNIEAHPGNVKPLGHRVKVQVTGAVFFDKMAHGNGHSKNGVEIHPILEIRSAN